MLFFIFLAVFSGDGSSDAMGNGLEAAFSLGVAFIIVGISAIVFLRESALGSHEKTTRHSGG